jgi:predicted metal-dependent peptidase
LYVNFCQTDDIPTAGVAVKDSDIFLFWNKDFMSSLNFDQVRGLLKHEAFHLVFQHCTTRSLEPHDVANLAADLAINCSIPSKELPTGGWVPGEIHIDPFTEQIDNEPLSLLVKSFPKDKSMEWYFTKLMESDEVKKLMKSGGMAEGGKGFDSHDGWGELSREEQELVKGKINEILKSAVNKADQQNRWGTVGSSMRDQLRLMISNKVDWKSILRQFVKFSRRGKTSTTWTSLHMSNLDEKFGPGCPGKRRGYESKLDVYIDQSGSMSDSDLILAFGELANFVRRTEFTTFHFDTEVDISSQMTWKGRGVPKSACLRTRCGGTDFTAATVHANLAKRKVDGMIIITDGGAPKPPKSNIRRGWLLVPGTELAFDPDPEDFVIRMENPPTV